MDHAMVDAIAVSLMAAALVVWKLYLDRRTARQIRKIRMMARLGVFE